MREAKAQIAPDYIKIDFALLLWLFVFGSVFGLLVENLFHLVVYHELESRAGLVWGPFSPIYGCGAVVLTVMLNRFYYTHDLVIFLIAMVLGSALEYTTSWMMETFWHAIAWDYTGTFGSIDGRTNFVFGMMWGALGLFWVRSIMPVIKWVGTHVDAKALWFKALTAAMTVFMAVNIVVTVLALHREGQRAVDIPAASPIDQWLDQTFTDEWLQARFANMTVSADVDAANHRAYQEQNANSDTGFKPLMP